MVRDLLLVLCLLCAVYGQRDNYYFPDQTREHRSRCYDEITGRAQRCVPEFGNAAFNLPVEATNTCGETYAITFCTQTGTRVNYCEKCDYLSYPPSHLTDFNNNENETWWQSETMYEDIQHPNQVNLTLHLRKAYDITFISLKFKSPRPESFAIFKRTKEDGPWIPYQYYSDTCRDTYSLPNRNHVQRGDEARALCDDEYSHISPLTGGTVAFSTLEGRPSAQNFENSPELQEWVTATDIRITLDRLNTFGDEVFGDRSVLQSYYYAITDLSVGGKCKCNGHASECRAGPYSRSPTECVCQHNTAGRDCEKCLDFYNDLPYSRATSTNAHECRPCNCNGRSNKCYFDQELYNLTGHGGHCIECAGNTDGPNCERCQPEYFLHERGSCQPCLCNDIGSRTPQCDTQGRCSCKPGVGGDKCDRCLADHYGFGLHGCHECGCRAEGSIDSQSTCNPNSGECFCKENVEGNRCHKCKPGFFSLDHDNEFGCTPCFCYGHSSECRLTPGYSETKITSDFQGGGDRWDAVDSRGRYAPLQYHSLDRTIGVRAGARETLYFSAPKKFLGDQRASYHQTLEFTLAIGDQPARPSVEDVVLESGEMKVYAPIFQQNNPVPSRRAIDYTFVLHEKADFGWTPRLEAKDFIRILSNLTAIKIRGNYAEEDVGFLRRASLTTAKRGVTDGRPARWVETCTCPIGYLGQFCESCTPGFRHEPPNSGPFARCVPCNCHKHANLCDAASGRCICKHNTAGDNCELCARGYYGNAVQGTKHDCTECPCPNRGPCLQLEDGIVACLECPAGYAGARCDLCTDGFFGDPTGKYGEEKDCEECHCNNNIDPNAVGNCNRTTGECLKCIYHTASPKCDICAPGYFGDALEDRKDKCMPCECNTLGSLKTARGEVQCNQISGQCHCKDYVTGRQCDQCVEGFYDLASGKGCTPCNCDATGALNQTCNPLNGQCYCREGVSGLQCSKCDDRFFGFSLEGCKPCDCDPIGSLDLQCDRNGQCLCRDNVEGRKCDQCKENRYNRQAGCVECPACYNLVQDDVNEHRMKLYLLDDLLENITNTPAIVDDKDFEEKLQQVQDRVDSLWTDARLAVNNGDGGESLVEQLGTLRERLEMVGDLIAVANRTVKEAGMKSTEGEDGITMTQNRIQEAQADIKAAKHHLETEGRDALDRALQKSQEFGQQSEKMSQIAREARELADSYEAEADEIDDVAKQALNKSLSALNLAEGSLEVHNKGREEVRKLQQTVDKAESWLKTTKIKAFQAKEEAIEASNDSVATLTAAHSLKLPDIEAVEPIQLKAKEIESEAQRIKDLADSLLADNEMLIDKLEVQMEPARQLLENAHKQQQSLDMMLEQLFMSSDNATKAVEMGNNILEGATQTLETLRGFDKLVRETKDEAQDALTTKDEILRLIQDAESKTYDARAALYGAEADAGEASTVAAEAQKVAEEASQEAGQIKYAADNTKTQANNVNDEAANLDARAAEMSGEITTLEQRAEEEQNMASQALQKANEAKTNSQVAQQKVEQALQDVQDITTNLQNAQDINSRQLDDLERRLEEAERMLEDAQIDQQLADLSNARELQNSAVESYEKELMELKAEVRNIEEIKDSLPEGCFKRLKLEP